jgi:hypothetical protein
VVAPYPDLPRVEEARQVISVADALPGLKQTGRAVERDGGYPDRLRTRRGQRLPPPRRSPCREQSYIGKVTVPTPRDTKTIVNNESSEIIMFYAGVDAISGDRTDFYPPTPSGDRHP